MQNQPHSFVENGSPEALRDFMHALPQENRCDINLVYLASHQSRDGEWDFTQKKIVPLSAIFEQAGVHKHRIVILDTCFAAAIEEQTTKLAPLFLFASSGSEETLKVSFHTPQPVDLAHRYPDAFTWLKECLGPKWDGEISFLGFVWVQTFLTAKDRPVTIDDWVEFLRQCQSFADQFRNNVGRKSSSQIILSVQ